MMQVTLISVGTVKESYLQQALQEYRKRLSAFCRLQEIELREARIADEDDPEQVRRALEVEGEQILSRIPAGNYRIALCVEGTQYDSPALAALLERGAGHSGKLTLIIGSSHGLSDTVKAACDCRLSVSKMTFPHQLMRVILLEGLYRSFTITAGKKYHK